MTGMKRCVLAVGLALLLLGAAVSTAQGLGGGQQADAGALGIRNRALEGGGAPMEGQPYPLTWAATERCVTCLSARGTAEDGQADLAVAKTDDPDPVLAGEMLTYTLAITNSGPVTATNVLVTDTLPSGVSFDDADPSQGTYNSVTGVWDVGSLADGGSATLALFVTVDPSRRGTLSNVAEVSATETDLVPGNNTYTETTAVDAETDLAIVKTDDPDPVIAGNPLTYTLVITNNGPSDATGVAVIDTLPSGVSFDDADPSQGWYNSVSGVWTVGSVADGGSATLTLFVTVAPATREALSNSAEVSGDETDPTPGNNAAENVETTVKAEADLAIVKTGDPEPVIAGNPLTYTLTVTNGGPSDATGVVVTDTLPLSVTLDTYAPSQGTFNDATGVWTVGSVADGGSATLTLVVAVDPSKRGSLRNVAEVSGDETDPNPVYNEHEEVTFVDAVADLAVAKADDPDPVSAGGALTYTLTVTNSGPSDATGVIVTDDLPDDATRLSATPSQGTCSGFDPVVCNVGPLASGANASVSLVVGVTSPLTNGTILTNTVTVSGDQTDPYTVTNSAQAQTRVQSSPVLTITKSDDSDPVPAGENLVYTLDIINSGNENATGVTVTEHYDPNVLFYRAYPPPDPGTGNRVWTLKPVTVGEPETIDVIVRVASPLPPGTVLTNRVTLDSTQTTPVTVTELTSVTSAAGLTVTEDDIPDPVQAGNDLIYLITYSNILGTADAVDVVITKTYDSRVTYISAVPPPRDGTDNVWDIGDLPVDAVGNILVTVRVDTPLASGTVLTNVVTMVSTGTMPMSVTESTTVSSAPALTLNVTDHPDPVRAGDPLAYTLRYSNTGNADATQAVVTATLDVSTTFSDATPPPTGGSGRVRYWDVGTIAGEDGQGNHGRGEIIIYADVLSTLPNSTTLEFRAQLADAEGDLVEYKAQTTVYRLPDLVIRPVGEGHTPSLFSPNKEMTYTVAYTNAGDGDALEVTITTTLPTGTVCVDYGWLDSGGGTYTYAHPDGLLPAHSLGYTVTFTVRHADTPEVSASEFNTPFTIGSTGDDENPADNTTSVDIGVPDLVVDSVSVVRDPNDVRPDVPVTFTLTITVMNQGSGTAWDPGDEGSFFVDVFTAPVASYPSVPRSQFYAEVDPIAAGSKSPPLVVTATITPGDRDPMFYIKVDSHERYDYGLVPEFDEMNNLWPPRAFLPIMDYPWDKYYEDNNGWPDAYGPLASGRTYRAYPDDINDWYYFTLPAWANVTVSVTDYVPTSGPNNTVALYGPAEGDERGPLIDWYRTSHHTSMVLKPPPLGRGRYYVLVFTPDRQSSEDLYRLTVTY